MDIDKIERLNRYYRAQDKTTDTKYEWFVFSDTIESYLCSGDEYGYFSRNSGKFHTFSGQREVRLDIFVKHLLGLPTD